MKLHYSQAVQEEVQPGCTRGSAARLYKRKCSQAVELALYHKRRELHCPFLIKGQFYTLQPGWISSCAACLHFLLYGLVVV